MREVTTIALDVLGLLLIAAGLVAFLWTWIGPIALGPGGVVILVASHWADRLTAPTSAPSKRVDW